MAHVYAQPTLASPRIYDYAYQLPNDVIAGCAMNPEIERAIALLGSQTKLASAIGVSQQYVSKILLGKKRITAEVAIKIEAATGFGVSRSQLCPQFWPPAPEPKARAVG